jgi:uncharacterized protein (UPF0332 family)
MAFNWEEFLAVSEILTNLDQIPYLEGRQRSAISRAYYAAYCMARDYVIAKNAHQHQLTGLSAHKVVHEFFLHRSDKISKSIGNDLDTMFSLRKLADYEGEMNQLESRVKFCIQRARLVIRQIKTLEQHDRNQSQ